MKILDVCCGGRMFWFDKKEPHTIYMDIRTFSGELCDGRKFNVNPDVIGDFRNIPFEDNTFDMVVFDPPHLVKGGDNGWQIIKYGKLNKESWKEDIRKGFEECFRVLKQEGVLIFKWNEQQIKINEVLPLCPFKPIFGQRGNGKTHWLVFLNVKNEGFEIFIKKEEAK